MAKATLPTNYRDDILNVSTEGKRKYRMNYNDDGTVSFVDVTPYDQEGSDFGAGDINATNEAVNQSFDKSKLIRDMDAINALTQEGFAPDALALKDVNDSLGTNIIIRQYEVPFSVSGRPSVDSFSYANLSKDIAVDGYTPIGIIGINNPVGHVTTVSRYFVNDNTFIGTILSNFVDVINQVLIITVLYKAN